MQSLISWAKSFQWISEFILLAEFHVIGIPVILGGSQVTILSIAFVGLTSASLLLDESLLSSLSCLLLLYNL